MARKSETKLTQQQVDRFRDDGFLYPIDAMSTDEATRLREGFEESERMQGFQFGRGCNFKPHLLYHWADELVHNSALLDAVEDIPAHTRYRRVVSVAVLEHMENLPRLSRAGSERWPTVAHKPKP